MRKDYVNVVPNKKKGCWSIHRGLNKTASKNYCTKREAEQGARSLCQKWGMSLALYNLDGKLSQRNSFVKSAAPQKRKPVRKPVQKKVVKRTRRSHR